MEINSKNMQPASPFMAIGGMLDLLHNSALFMAGSRAKARMVIIVAAEPVEHLFKKKKRQIIYKKLNDQPEMYHCRLLTSDIDETEQPEWVMTNYKNKDIFLIISFGNYEAFQRILRFLKGLYPKIARTYFNTGYIYDFLRKIDKGHDKLHIRITKLVARKRIESECAQKVMTARMI